MGICGGLMANPLIYDTLRQFLFPEGSLNPNAPVDMFAALGKTGSSINVIPSQNMVWIQDG